GMGQYSRRFAARAIRAAWPSGLPPWQLPLCGGMLRARHRAARSIERQGRASAPGILHDQGGHRMNEATFLQAILERPDDDLPRLASADWLMESGDEERAARGELIQVQAQLANRAEGLGAPTDWVDAASAPRLKSREQALLAQYGKEWAGPVAGLV